MKVEKKKTYSFRFGTHINNCLSNLAAKYKMDRTEMLEYMITVWANMWDANEMEKKNNEA